MRRDTGPGDRPSGAGPEDPQHAVEHRTILPPWAPPAVCAARQLGQEGPNQNPLLVGEVTGMRRSRKGHPGQNGPVAIWLLAPTQNRSPDRRYTRVIRFARAACGQAQCSEHSAAPVSACMMSSLGLAKAARAGRSRPTANRNVRSPSRFSSRYRKAALAGQRRMNTIRL
jgi:hypothetical protein